MSESRQDQGAIYSLRNRIVKKIQKKESNKPAEQAGEPEVVDNISITSSIRSAVMSEEVNQGAGTYAATTPTVKLYSQYLQEHDWKVSLQRESEYAQLIRNIMIKEQLTPVDQAMVCDYLGACEILRQRRTGPTVNELASEIAKLPTSTSSGQRATGALLSVSALTCSALIVIGAPLRTRLT